MYWYEKVNLSGWLAMSFNRATCISWPVLLTLHSEAVVFL